MIDESDEVKMIELPVVNIEAADQDKPRERYWRSVAHLQNDPELRAVMGEELMPGAAERPGGATRRQFLQVMGASMAMAGLAACRRPIEKTLPYTRQPEEIIPGLPLYFASAMPLRGVLRPILVESHEGRPTKIEGNPEHPMSRGATGVFEQASILNLYDPDRSHTLVHDRSEATWRDFMSFAQRFAAGAAARRVAVLAEPTSSPTLQALRRQLATTFPQSRWITYRPEGDNPERLAMQQAAGRPVRPLYRFSNAEVIVSLDADFLGPTELNFVSNTSEFAQSRRVTSPDDDISRLYVAESTYSLTGGMADNRMRIRASEIPALASALAAELGFDGQSQGRFQNHPFVAAAARDLQQAGSNGVVLAGESQPAEIHALAAAINAGLGAVGNTVTYLDLEEEVEEPQSLRLAGLVEDMRAGNIDVLLMLGVNPVYDAPAELNFADALLSVEDSIHLGFYVDETGRASRWHIPRSHYLEAWGDGRAYDGTLSVIQPLIAPLYDTKSECEVVNAFVRGTDVSGYDLVREQWGTYVPGNFDEGWSRIIHDGFLPNSAYATTSVGQGEVFAGAVSEFPEDEMEVVFRLDPTVFDGEYANNAWMQELPDPTTKIVWDNVALMSPATAERLEITQVYRKGAYIVDVVEVRLGGRAVEIPAWIQPGLPDNSIQVTLGYGRDIATTRPARKARFFDLDTYTDIYAEGPLANGVGQNVAPLRSSLMERVAIGAEVTKTGQSYTIVTTQEHGSMEGRPLVRKATMDDFRSKPDFADAAVPLLPGAEAWNEFPALWEDDHPSDQPAYQEDRYHVNQWGMVIDLNTCTGCSSCVVACNSENNIQMVGKDEVGRGREMHWLRIDRYFVSDEDNVDEPEMVVQPLPCMHCENAPCESVCPVAATVHSTDGTNQMIYNRCIGTRYCSNNCPYKVRHFNFFNWSKTMPTTVQMAQNPDVTVRFRGVMEKCSYCVQRIREKQREANLEQRSIRDGDVKTACQQVCPAEAITFGDLNDPNSKVSREKRNSRRYEMLAELNVKPRTSYLARVTNPNTELTS